MKVAMKNVVMIGMLMAMSICLTGCFQMMGESAHDNAVKNFPTYAETKAEWGTVPDGYGRVVLFVEKVGMSPFGGFGYMDFIYEVNDASKTIMTDQTFVFIDLPAGKNSFKCYPPGSFYHGKPIEFEVLSGQITYIRGSKGVTSQEAETLLENIHHFFRKPLPFDKQGESAEKVTF